ncbi:zinc-binding alcohol dehydrogenase family protein [Paraburkholderia fungorum]|uniref:Oxidoreductase n=1 Tax=Paraburkholderia fungorum TaxID=134537 RepID=A0A3R7EVN9_9BURK|nr:zinc-binding alcohol dehydrogenase family protein [Paraburkholderia fungorum]RKF49880.1 oxidoreductase [Paraburkholderia fungorum]
MKAVRVTAPSANVDSLELNIATQPKPDVGSDECLVQVVSAGVNPSDVKAVLGAMPHAVWPRTPGREYAGVVLEGPADLVGKEVWGIGGELGIRRNGSHGHYLIVPTTGVRVKPASLTMEEAGSIGVPFTTAFEGLRRAGGAKKGDVLLVLGANGKVGQAAIQLATMAGAKVFGVERTRQAYQGHASGEVTMIDASSQQIDEVVRELTDGHGADIVYNTVGSPYFEQANKALATRGTQIFISTIDRAVPFDIFSFYRGQHTYVGVDTLAFDCIDNAQILDQLLPAFESGALKPFPIDRESVFSLDDAALAYQAVLRGSTNRVLLKP